MVNFRKQNTTILRKSLLISILDPYSRLCIYYIGLNDGPIINILTQFDYLSRCMHVNIYASNSVLNIAI
jgi:hypothetical protein